MEDITVYDPDAPDSEVVARFTMRRTDLYSLDMWLTGAIATAIEVWLPYQNGMPATEESEKHYHEHIMEIVRKLKLATDDNNDCVGPKILDEVHEGLVMLADTMQLMWI